MAELTIEQRQAIAKANARLRLKNRDGTDQTTTQSLPEIGSMTDLPGPRGRDARETEPGVRDSLVTPVGPNERTTGRSTNQRLGVAFATTPDPEARKDIIRKAIPGTEFSEDEEGNTVITLPDGRQAFLNRPGLSMQDFADFASDVVKFLPAGRFAAGGKGLLRRIARGGAAAAATSGAEDVGATLQGSEQGFQGGKAGGTVAADVVAETAARPLGAIGRVLKRTFGRRTGDVFDADGNLTNAARQALTRAGIDPDQISPDLAMSAIRASEEGAEGALGVAQSQRFGVPLTRGQATGDFRQLSIEESFRGRADEPGNIIREFDRRQNERLVELDKEIQEELGGSQRALSDEEEAGVRIGGTVRERAAELELAIDDAYQTARGTEATLNREGLDRLADVPDVLRENGFRVNEKLMPATSQALREVEELSGDEFNSRTLAEIEDTRKVLGNLIGAAKNRADKRAVTLIKKRYDKYLDDAFDNALFSGDEEALELLKKARGLRAEFGRRFQEQTTKRTPSGKKVPDPGGKAIESILEHNVTDEGVVNMLFGRARVFNSENAVKTIRALRRASGNSEDVNNTLKQLTFRRISSQAIDKGKFSPGKFVSAFDRVMDQNPGVLKEVFSKDELSTLRDFRNTVERTIQPEKTQNPSGTAQALVNAFGKLGQVIGLQKGGIGFGSIFGQTFRSVGGAVERSGASETAREAVNPQLLLPGRPNAAVIATAIASARQGGPTAIEEGAELVGSIDQIGRSTEPDQTEEQSR